MKAGTGDHEPAWLAFLAGLALPDLDLARAPARAVVLAPHPDDEVLGVGGLLRLLSDAGTAIEVLAVTDGEASHPGSTALSRDELARRRGAEVRSALRALGVRAGVRHLGLPDGGAEALEQPVLAALGALSLAPGDWLLAPWSGDGHPDHEAVGRAAERAGRRLLAYPVWAWHRTTPADSAMPWQRAQRVLLPASVQRAKAAAVACFVTQVEPLGAAAEDGPVLSPAFLRHHARAFEVVFG